MQNCLAELTNKLTKIKSYIQYIENTGLFGAYKCDLEVACTVLKTYKQHDYSEKKIIEYNALIISLYGAYENFINELLKKYLMQLIQIIPEYEQLPEQLKEAHYINTIQILKDIDTRKYSGMNRNTLIENMYHCENNHTPYQINFEAVLIHSSNMWIDTINELLKRVGIDDFFNTLKNRPSFRTLYLKRCEGDFEPAELIEIIASRNISDLTSPISNLIAERNRVAHSWVDEINIEVIKEQYISYIDEICKTIYDMLEDSILRYERKYNSSLIQVKELLASKIYLINNSTSIFYKNEKIIIEKGDGCSLEYGLITGIRIDDKDVEFSDPNTEFSIRIEPLYSKKIKSNAKLYKISRSLPINYSPINYTSEKTLHKILENNTVKDMIIEEVEDKCLGLPFNCECSVLEWFDDMDIYQTTVEESNISETDIVKDINLTVHIIITATGVGYYQENTYCEIPLTINVKTNVRVQLSSIPLDDSNILSLTDEDMQISVDNISILSVDENLDEIQFIETDEE